MSTLHLVANSLVHVAALSSVAAMFFRSQLLLRGFLLAGTLLNAIYFSLATPEILWGPVFWSLVMFAVNSTMIALLVLDRTMFGLSRDEVALFRTFGVFTPGEYRRLMRLAVWHEPNEADTLTVRGAPVSRLYYLLSGEARVTRVEGVLAIGAGSFIGEIAFLRGTPASASVTVAAGSRYVAFDRAALAALLARRPAIGVALGTLLNADLAGKVAGQTAPEGQSGLALA